MIQLFGKYRAEVVDVNDPEKRGRIRVKCPSVMKDDTPLNWAECCFVPGLFSLPGRKDIVWIEFEGGHIDKPIWSGILMTKAYASKFGAYDVTKKMIITTKHTMELNDTADEFKLTSTKTVSIAGENDNIALT